MQEETKRGYERLFYYRQHLLQEIYKKESRQSITNVESKTHIPTATLPTPSSFAHALIHSFLEVISSQSTASPASLLPFAAALEKHLSSFPPFSLSSVFMGAASEVAATPPAESTLVRAKSVYESLFCWLEEFADRSQALGFRDLCLHLLRCSLQLAAALGSLSHILRVGVMLDQWSSFLGFLGAEDNLMLGKLLKGMYEPLKIYSFCCPLNVCRLGYKHGDFLLPAILSLKTTTCCMDESHIYIHAEDGLMKVCSGLGEGIRGNIVALNTQFRVNEKGWLAYLNGFLYYRSSFIGPASLVVLSAETLEVVGELSTSLPHFPLQLERNPSHDMVPLTRRSPILSDGKHLYAIESIKEKSSPDALDSSACIVGTMVSCYLPSPHSAPEGGLRLEGQVRLPLEICVPAARIYCSQCQMWIPGMELRKHVGTDRIVCSQCLSCGTMGELDLLESWQAHPVTLSTVEATPIDVFARQQWLTNGRYLAVFIPAMENLQGQRSDPHMFRIFSLSSGAWIGDMQTDYVTVDHLLCSSRQLGLYLAGNVTNRQVSVWADLTLFDPLDFCSANVPREEVPTEEQSSLQRSFSSQTSDFMRSCSSSDEDEAVSGMDCDLESILQVPSDDDVTCDFRNWSEASRSLLTIISKMLTPFTVMELMKHLTLSTLQYSPTVSSYKHVSFVPEGVRGILGVLVERCIHRSTIQPGEAGFLDHSGSSSPLVFEGGFLDRVTLLQLAAASLAAGVSGSEVAVFRELLMQDNFRDAMARRAFVAGVHVFYTTPGQLAVALHYLLSSSSPMADILLQRLYHAPNLVDVFLSADSPPSLLSFVLKKSSVRKGLSIRILLKLQRQLFGSLQNYSGSSFSMVTSYCRLLLCEGSALARTRLADLQEIASSASSWDDTQTCRISDELRGSFLGVLVPGLLTSLPALMAAEGKTYRALMAPMVDLVESLAEMTPVVLRNSDPSSHTEEMEGGLRERPRTVESLHPQGTLPSLEEVVYFPSAAVLCVTFDLLCETVDESSKLELLPKVPLSSGPPLRFGGKRGSWPQKPLYLAGESVKIVFTDSGNSSPAWGFRLTVKPIYPPYHVNHWLSDLLRTAVMAAGRCASILIRGDALDADEAAALPHLQLFAGGLCDQSYLSALDQTEGSESYSATNSPSSTSRKSHLTVGGKTHLLQSPSSKETYARAFFGEGLAPFATDTAPVRERESKWLQQFKEGSSGNNQPKLTSFVEDVRTGSDESAGMRFYRSVVPEDPGLRHFGTLSTEREFAATLLHLSDIRDESKALYADPSRLARVLRQFRNKLRQLIQGISIVENLSTSPQDSDTLNSTLRSIRMRCKLLRKKRPSISRSDQWQSSTTAGEANVGTEQAPFMAMTPGRTGSCDHLSKIKRVSPVVIGRRNSSSDLSSFASGRDYGASRLPPSDSQLLEFVFSEISTVSIRRQIQIQESRAVARAVGLNALSTLFALLGDAGLRKDLLALLPQSLKDAALMRASKDGAHYLDFIETCSYTVRHGVVHAFREFYRVLAAVMRGSASRWHESSESELVVLTMRCWALRYNLEDLVFVNNTGLLYHTRRFFSPLSEDGQLESCSPVNEVEIRRVAWLIFRLVAVAASRQVAAGEEEDSEDSEAFSGAVSCIQTAIDLMHAEITSASRRVCEIREEMLAAAGNFIGASPTTHPVSKARLVELGVVEDHVIAMINCLLAVIGLSRSGQTYASSAVPFLSCYHILLSGSATMKLAVLKLLRKVLPQQPPMLAALSRADPSLDVPAIMMKMLEILGEAVIPKAIFQQSQEVFHDALEGDNRESDAETDSVDLGEELETPLFPIHLSRVSVVPTLALLNGNGINAQVKESIEFDGLSHAIHTIPSRDRFGHPQTFDVSEEALYPFGMSAGDRVMTPQGVGTVIGVNSGSVHFMLEGSNQAISFEFSSSTAMHLRRMGFRPLNLRSARMEDGSLMDFDCSPESLGRFGISPTDALQTPGGIAKILGVWEGKLFYQLPDEKWPRFANVQSIEALRTSGLRPIPNPHSVVAATEESVPLDKAEETVECCLLPGSLPVTGVAEAIRALFLELAQVGSWRDVIRHCIREVLKKQEGLFAALMGNEGDHLSTQQEESVKQLVAVYSLLSFPLSYAHVGQRVRVLPSRKSVNEGPIGTVIAIEFSTSLVHVAVDGVGDGVVGQSVVVPEQRVVPLNYDDLTPELLGFTESDMLALITLWVVRDRDVSTLHGALPATVEMLGLRVITSLLIHSPLKHVLDDDAKLRTQILDVSLRLQNGVYSGEEHELRHSWTASLMAMHAPVAGSTWNEEREDLHSRFPYSPFDNVPVLWPRHVSTRPSRGYLVTGLQKRSVIQYDPSQSRSNFPMLLANVPVPESASFYYFEMTIACAGRVGYISIGLCPTGLYDEPVGLPGWRMGSYGYHGDNGQKYGSYHQGKGLPYGPEFGTGDVVGCGWDRGTGNVFFTKNGVHLGIAFTHVFTQCYPAFGLASFGGKISLNFGQDEFRYPAYELAAGGDNSSGQSSLITIGALGERVPAKVHLENVSGIEEKLSLQWLQENGIGADDRMEDLWLVSSKARVPHMWSVVPGSSLDVIPALCEDWRRFQLSANGGRVLALNRSKRKVTLSTVDPFRSLSLVLNMDVASLALPVRHSMFDYYATPEDMLDPKSIAIALGRNSMRTLALHTWCTQVSLEPVALPIEPVISSISCIRPPFVHAVVTTGTDTSTSMSSGIPAEMISLMRRADPYILAHTIHYLFGRTETSSFALGLWLLKLLVESLIESRVHNILPEIYHALVDDLLLALSARHGAVMNAAAIALMRLLTPFQWDVLRMRRELVSVTVMSEALTKVWKVEFGHLNQSDPKRPRYSPGLRLLLQAIATWRRVAFPIGVYDDGVLVAREEVRYSEEYAAARFDDFAYLSAIEEFSTLMEGLSLRSFLPGGLVRKLWLSETRRSVVESLHPFPLFPKEEKFISIEGAKALQIKISQDSSAHAGAQLTLCAPDCAPILLSGESMAGTQHRIASDTVKIIFEPIMKGGFEWKGVGCDLCRALPLLGVRYHCVNCQDFDCCEHCLTSLAQLHDVSHVFVRNPFPFPAMTSLRAMAIHRLTSEEGREEVRCSSCRVVLEGAHAKCLLCPDYMLCLGCLQQMDINEGMVAHPPKHTFAFRFSRDFDLAEDFSTANLSYPEESFYGYKVEVIPEFPHAITQLLCVSQAEELHGLTRELLSWTHSMDVAFVKYVAEVCDNFNIDPLSITSHNVLPLPPSLLMQAPQLASFSERVLSYRLRVLIEFNYLFKLCLPALPLGFAVPMLQHFSRTRSLIFPSVKSQYWKAIMEHTKSPTGTHPLFTVDRMGKLSTTFEQVARQLLYIPPHLLRSEDQGFKVSLAGEGAQDVGGPYSEVISEISAELHAGKLSLFIPTPNSRSEVGEDRDQVMPNPRLTSPLDLSHFRAVGMLMGIAIRTGVYMTVNIPHFFWKLIMGDLVDLDDLRSVDEGFWKLCMDMQQFGEMDLNEETFESVFVDMFPDQRFVTVSADTSEIELEQGGRHRQVTWTNLSRFLSTQESFHLHEFDVQVAAIRRGLTDILVTDQVGLFTEVELMEKVNGRGDFDVAYLKSHAEYYGISQTSPVVQFLWEVLQEFSRDERRAFLRFVWGRTALPAPPKDFKFKIKAFSKSGMQDQFLPEADTCFFVLKLPTYSSKEILRERLLYAISTCREIDADYMVNERDLRMVGAGPPPLMTESNDCTVQ